MFTVLGTLAAAALSQTSFAPDAALFPKGFTCAAALEAERSIGANTTYEGPYDPKRGALVFHRKYRGDDASVIYMCGGSLVGHRLIIMRFRTLQDTQLAFDRHRAALVEQLGKACWDPDALSAAQLARLPNHDLSHLGWFRYRIEWNARPGQNATLTMSTKQLQVTLTVDSLATSAPIGADNLIGEIYNMSKCAKGSGP